jgi:hypothetical protein
MKSLIIRSPLVIIVLFFLNSCSKNESGKVTQLPVAPTALKATVFSSTAITLSWSDNSGDEDGFKIERKNGTADFALIATIGANKNVYKDSLLTPYTTYTYRVYAYNATGQSKAYTNLDSATTIGVPVLTTATITGITSATAKGGGNITSDGGSAITARGVCWSTTASPTTTNSKTTDSTGLGIFNSVLTGLTAGTTYYVRSYATNSAGTSYGNEEIFTTTDLPYDVYVAGLMTNGSGAQMATVWKNGVATQLGTNNSWATSIYVNGSDLYVAGFDGTNAAVWKNGVGTQLGNGDARSIFIAGGDVYIAGFTNSTSGGNQTATLWKNGTANQLDNGNSWASSVYVAGTDVHVAGSGGSAAHTTVWRNGLEAQLGSGDGEPRSIYVVGTDEYIAGSTYNANIGGLTATVWKNGVATHLGSGTGNAQSIYCIGTDVYVAGAMYDATSQHYFPVVWKNGVATPLGTWGAAYSVYVVANDIYVAGCMNDANGTQIVTVWKNGVATQLGSGYAMSVFVTSK